MKNLCCMVVVLFNVNIYAQTGWGDLSQIRIAVAGVESLTQEISFDNATFRNQFESALVAQRVFTIVERLKLDEILSEQELQLSGLIGTEATRVGGLLGAQKIIIPSIGKWGSQYTLTVRSIDVRTGIVDLADQAIFSHQQDVLQLIPEMAKRFVRLVRGEPLRPLYFQVLEASPSSSQSASVSIEPLLGAQTSANGTISDRAAMPENVLDGNPNTWWIGYELDRPSISLGFRNVISADTLHILLGPSESLPGNSLLRSMSLPKKIKITINGSFNREFDLPPGMQVFQYDFEQQIIVSQLEVQILDVWPGRRRITGLGDIYIGLQ